MKAMVLAAGLGERLHPYSATIPKPLFPIDGLPLLDGIIRSLERAGCNAIIINTHHLPHMISDFIEKQTYTIPVHIRYEPVLLGTGGGMKNVADFWDEHPFMVINSDIVTDVDLREVYHFHLDHRYPVTVVLHDDTALNTVSIDENEFVIRFNPEKDENQDDSDLLTFTGIQILDPSVLDLIPENVFSHSIDEYAALLARGEKIKAYISSHSYWKDIGTPERYREVVFDKMAPQAFKQAFDCCSQEKKVPFICTPLKGDGSDRQWYRIIRENDTLIMVDHGIRNQNTTAEVDSFIAIGRHLHDADIPVPKMYCHDNFSGLVFLEDLGDENLQHIVKQADSPKKIEGFYQSVIEQLVHMSVFGRRGFDPSWTYQTSKYDKQLIIERECRYFETYFSGQYLSLETHPEILADEFERLADRALEFSVEGFMHRDFQSRNIMVKNNRIYFIDFQGGRIGPIQYDLASLLIDPYVALDHSLQDRLLSYCIERLSSVTQIDPDTFKQGYNYCTITRNLQILGAFAFLSQVKKKSYFEDYIPVAVNSLKSRSPFLKDEGFFKLHSVVELI